MRRRANDYSMSFFDLRDAMAQPGCPVCRLKFDSADRFLESLLWESVNDPAKRHRIRRARGFCYEHAWSLVHAGASVGVAIIARDVLQSVLETLEDAAFDAVPSFSLRRVQETLDSKQPSAATAEVVEQLGSEAPCPACAWADKMEGIYLDTLDLWRNRRSPPYVAVGQHNLCPLTAICSQFCYYTTSLFIRSLIGKDELLGNYKASDGLCLPHFRQALALVRKEATFGTLVCAQRAIWERLVGHLSESIRKSDYRHLDEVWGEEAGAWIRAVTALVGARPDDKAGRARSPAWSFKRSDKT